jgi:hypothetical protein
MNSLLIAAILLINFLAPAILKDVNNNGLLVAAIISPLVIVMAPTYWATIFLLCEKIWMALGFYRVIGIRPRHLEYSIKKFLKFKCMM